THLDLRDNQLKDSSVKILFVLTSHFFISLFRLEDCRLSEISCSSVVSALKPSLLKHPDLSNNKLQDSGAEQLCGFLESPLCSLQTLRLSGCGPSSSHCEVISSALNSDPSHLTHLDLRDNQLKDSSVKILCAGLKSPNCKLETLRSVQCEARISSKIKVCPHISLLSLSVQVGGLQVVRDQLFFCGLSSEALPPETSGPELSGCGPSSSHCEVISSALNSDPSHLTHLDLRDNQLKDSSVKILCAGLKSPNCKLETLRSVQCEARISSKIKVCPHISLLSLSVQLVKQPLNHDDGLWLSSCPSSAVISSALNSDPSHLTHLDLRDNQLKDSSVKILCAGLKSPNCKLETLRSVQCEARISSKIKVSLKPSLLKHPDLSNNKLQDSGAEQLCGFLESPLCSLQTLR
uniref:NACHT LRR and PYD domain-containing protein n=1 Tax=Salarias fasciatus TaxID=181472 RepID=A0A672GRJ9_SALFA